MTLVIANIRFVIFQRPSCLVSIQIIPVLYPSYNVKLFFGATKVKKLTGF